MARSEPARLILLHGWAMTGASFAPLIEALEAEGFNAIEAPDLPGHGGAGAPSLEGGMALLAGLLERGPAVVVGWSMGALIAWRLAEQSHQNLIANLRGIVSLDMSPRPFPDWEFGLRGLTGAEARTQTERFRSDWPPAARAFTRAMFPPRLAPPGLDPEALAETAAGLDPALMAPFWQEILAADHRAVLAGLALPLLAIHGAESRLYPSGCAAWIAQTAPSGRAEVIPDTGHAPHIEAPARVAAAIRRFCEEIA